MLPWPNRYSTNALGQHNKGLQCGEESRLLSPDHLIEWETSLLGNHDVRMDQWEIAPNGSARTAAFCRSLLEVHRPLLAERLRTKFVEPGIRMARRVACYRSMPRDWSRRSC